MESRRNGPQLSSHHADDDECNQLMMELLGSQYELRSALRAQITPRLLSDELVYISTTLSVMCALK